jgi:hypothetical protein
MSEPAKDAAFAFESFFSRAPGERNVYEFHRSLSLEPAVTTTGEPDASHSALANLRDQRVRTKRLARESCGIRQLEPPILQKTFLRQHPVFFEKPSQLRSQCGILLA